MATLEDVRDDVTVRHDVTERDGVIERVLAEGVQPEQLMEEYDSWATTFDTSIAAHGYNGPEQVAEKVTKLFGDNKSVNILDLAAGSGLVGAQLHKQGFTNIDAVDANQEMLKEARKKNVYRRLICDFVGTNRLDIADDAYDAVVVSGSFAPNHLNEDCFEELIRITKPRGLVVLLIGVVWIPEVVLPRSNLELKMQALEEAGRWRLLERDVVDNYFRGYSACFFVLQVA